ncbi:MAG: hypothetical protein CMJ48_05440 [Planctomycetaceae bacterium]|nr:hypothetical protein [Planctomycetaceae bacterium]
MAAQKAGFSKNPGFSTYEEARPARSRFSRALGTQTIAAITLQANELEKFMRKEESPMFD